MIEANKRRAVMGTLVLVHALLPLAALAISYWIPGNFHVKWVARNAVRVVAFGEAGLLGTWLGLAGRPTIWRLAGGALGATECWCVLVLRHPDAPRLNLAAYLLVPSALNLALAFAIRRTSIQAPADDAGRFWQFSVSQLLVFTGLVGVLIALAQQFFKLAIVVHPLLVVSEGSQIAVLAMVWATMHRRRGSVRAGIAAIVSFSVGVIVQSYLSDSYFWSIIQAPSAASPWQWWEDWLSIPTFTLLLSLFAAVTVQAAGYCGIPLESRPCVSPTGAGH